jgi:hypothetical protein
VAASLADELQRVAAARGIVLSTATRPGCGMVTGIPTLPDGSEVPWGQACADGTFDYLDQVIQQHEPTTALWLSTWETADRIIDGKLYRFGSAGTDAALLAKLEESRLHLTGEGARLMILTNTPRAEHSDIRAGDPTDDAKIERLNRLYRRFAAAHPETVTVVDLEAIVCPAGPPCPETVHGLRLRPHDGSHFEGDGPGYVVPRLLDAIARAAEPAPGTGASSTTTLR